jgi:TonB-linked SusC/RagA family outer membrane protein
MAALVLCGTALGQQIGVSGFVTSVDGSPLDGVLVRVQGTDIRTTTDADGRYAVTAPADGVLIFARIGFRALGLDIAGRTTLDVTLERAIAVLDEVVVTGYAEQRRADITGAVASVDMESMLNESSAGVLQRLDARVSGVTVDNSGNPGGRSTVRIRGISSFQNNDPLYIIDGTPLEESFLNWLNPNDVESIQVLKDASAASIYGSRATNGVVIIETRKRGSSPEPVFRLDAKFGMAQPVRGYDAFMITDALEYHEVIRRAHVNAGLAVPQNIYGDPNDPSVPAYIWPNNGLGQTNDLSQFGLTEDDYLFGDITQQNRQIMPASTGTNWWDVVFGTGYAADVNLGVRGSSQGLGYNVSVNYFDQEGTAAFNRYQRGSARVNTQFQIGKFRIGENVALAFEASHGGLGDPGGFAEDNIMGKNILMQPVVPIYDASGENFASGKAITLGVGSNPLRMAWADKDDGITNLRIFGNVFAGFDFTDDFSFTSRFGFSLLDQAFVNFDPIQPEDREPTFNNGFTEWYQDFRDWTWSNVFNYSTRLSDVHAVSLLVGQEASKNQNRFAQGSFNGLITTDLDARYIQDAIGDAATKNVFSVGGKSSLLSFFGKVDYNFAERYYLSATVRRDGSSRLGPDSRWGTFPAFSVGWRLSQEPFMQDNTFFTNVMLRFGYGVTGNQSIPSGRTVTQLGGDVQETFYDIGGTGNQVQPGFRGTSLGNDSLQWEENRSINLGLDVEFFRGNVSLVIDAYQRNTDNLLFSPEQPATAGPQDPPFLNVGEMRNRGVDISLGFRGTVGNTGTWRVALNGAHYRNEVIRIDGVSTFFFGPIDTRFGNQIINRVGDPIGAFYGLEWDGFFEDDAAVAAHASQDGAAPGRIRFADQPTIDTDNDGVPDQADGLINAEDRVIIGSPHPDFTAGLDLGLNIGSWDFAATFFGTFGNDIFDVQKEFYVFRLFETNVRKDRLTDSWESGADNTNAKYPQLDQNDVFSGQLSSFYVEDGSYIRLRTLQVGYTLPPSWIPGTRVYVQGENLFTITGYSGLDPALPAADIGGASGDIRDQYRGVDRGAYPSNRVLSFGISTTF